MVLDTLEVDPDTGLSGRQWRRRLSEYGHNVLKEAKSRSALSILFDQFKSLIMVLLLAAGLVSFAFGEWKEGAAIVAVIVVNAAIGFFTELRAVRSMEALRQLGKVVAKVRRDGEVSTVPAQQLVPGDIVVLEGGDIVSADMRLIEASKLQADESALTGESVPVSKGTDPVEAEAPLAERSAMLYKGTAVTRGSGEAVVVATGMDTELGRISSLVEEAHEEETPLEKRLDRLARNLIWVTLAVAALVAAAGLLRRKELLLMIETSIALAVAAIPEGLPIVATIALARGMWRMVRKNALINRLSSVETLGATNVIFTDKTGTLTENQMTVVSIVLDSGEVAVTGKGLERQGRFEKQGEPVDPHEDDLLLKALEIGVLCNNANLPEGEDDERKAVGDPLEIAFLVAGAKAGLERGDLCERYPEEREEAFESETKMMATFNRLDGSLRVAVKGAPEAVLDACTHVAGENGRRELSGEERDAWLERSRKMAADGLRMLALAEKNVDDVDAAAYEDLTFVALAALLDPPREDVKSAVDACHRAGIKVVMVTGDQAGTARNVAVAVGLAEEGAEVVNGAELASPEELTEEEKRRCLEAAIFARVSPEQKLDLIALQQEAGRIVAMTGDGVNDAPALKKADIGIAMGRRGTQVAREAADMVLQDDAFGTIVAAIEEGRVIFANIRKFVVYLLSCNISEVMTVFLASVANAPLPILPLQILYLNLVTDVFPALALGVGEGEPGIMDRPPRAPGEPILTRAHWMRTGGFGLLITAAVLGSLAWAIKGLGMEATRAVTVSFLTLAFAQLWHVFNMRESGSAFLCNDVTRNRWVWGALGLCAALLVAAVYVPPLAHVLKLARPGLSGWLSVAGMSLVPWALGQAWNSLRSGGEKRPTT